MTLNLIIRLVNVALICLAAAYMTLEVAKLFARSLLQQEAGKASVMMGSAFFCVAVACSIEAINVSRYYFFLKGAYVPISILLPYTFQKSLILYGYVVGTEYIKKRLKVESFYGYK